MNLFPRKLSLYGAEKYKVENFPNEKATSALNKVGNTLVELLEEKTLKKADNIKGFLKNIILYEKDIEGDEDNFLLQSSFDKLSLFSNLIIQYIVSQEAHNSSVMQNVTELFNKLKTKYISYDFPQLEGLRTIKNFVGAELHQQKDEHKQYIFHMLVIFYLGNLYYKQNENPLEIILDLLKNPHYFNKFLESAKGFFQLRGIFSSELCIRNETNINEAYLYFLKVFINNVNDYNGNNNKKFEVNLSFPLSLELFDSKSNLAESITVSNEFLSYLKLLTFEGNEDFYDIIMMHLQCSWIIPKEAGYNHLAFLILFSSLLPKYKLTKIIKELQFINCDHDPKFIREFYKKDEQFRNTMNFEMDTLRYFSMKGEGWQEILIQCNLNYLSLKQEKEYFKKPLNDIIANKSFILDQRNRFLIPNKEILKLKFILNRLENGTLTLPSNNTWQPELDLLKNPPSSGEIDANQLLNGLTDLKPIVTTTHITVSSPSLKNKQLQHKEHQIFSEKTNIALQRKEEQIEKLLQHKQLLLKQLEEKQKLALNPSKQQSEI